MRELLELIDPYIVMWDEGLVRSIFHPLDVQTILHIPLDVEVLDNFFALHYTKENYSLSRTGCGND
jgi:hypothetical protein